MAERRFSLFLPTPQRILFHFSSNAVHAMLCIYLETHVIYDETCLNGDYLPKKRFFFLYTVALFFCWKPDPNMRRSKQRTLSELLNFLQRQLLLQSSKTLLKGNDKRTRHRFYVHKIAYFIRIMHAKSLLCFVTNFVCKSYSK